jgi:hypothetical protein
MKYNKIKNKNEFYKIFLSLLSITLKFSLDYSSTYKTMINNIKIYWKQLSFNWNLFEKNEIKMLNDKSINNIQDFNYFIKILNIIKKFNLHNDKYKIINFIFLYSYLIITYYNKSNYFKQQIMYNILNLIIKEHSNSKFKNFIKYKIKDEEKFKKIIKRGKNEILFFLICSNKKNTKLYQNLCKI